MVINVCTYLCQVQCNIYLLHFQLNRASFQLLIGEGGAMYNLPSTISSSQCVRPNHRFMFATGIFFKKIINTTRTKHFMHWHINKELQKNISNQKQGKISNDPSVG